MAITAGAAKRRPIDFSNVKESSGVNKVRMPEGDYAAKILKVSEGPSKKDPTVPMWEFIFQLKDRPSATYPYFVVLQENQLWKLRNLLIAAGKQVPKKRINVDPNNLIGSLIGVTLIDAEYQGNEQSEVDGVLPVSELSDDDTPVEDDADEPADPDDGDDTAADEDGDLDLDDL